MGLWPLWKFYSFSRGGRLQMSESEVYRRQILTSRVGPRAERVKDHAIIIYPVSSQSPAPAAARRLKAGSYGFRAHAVRRLIRLGSPSRMDRRCPSQQPRDAAPMLGKCWAGVADAGPVFTQHWSSVSCSLGWRQAGTSAPRLPGLKASSQSPAYFFMSRDELATRGTLPTGTAFHRSPGRLYCVDPDKGTWSRLVTYAYSYRWISQPAALQKYVENFPFHMLK